MIAQGNVVLVIRGGAEWRPWRNSERVVDAGENMTVRNQKAVYRTGHSDLLVHHV